MKKSLIALAILATAAGAAQAQSNVTIYGQVDLQIDKASGRTTSMRAGDNNKLGFRGVEDLGGGLKALFHVEMRFDADTGGTEAAPNRPLFQGQSRVGLQGEFGMIRLGRGLTAVQESAAGYEAWGEARNRASLTSHITANYNSDPLYTGSSTNRWSNGVWYNSPVVGGFQLNATMTTKEPQGTGSPVATPYSISATFNEGPFSIMGGIERNPVDTKFAIVAASFKVMPDLKVMGSYARQSTVRNFDTKGWQLGMNYNVGAGVILAGYGQIKPDNTRSSKRFAIGYEHHLSKRTFLYTDAYRDRNATNSVNSFDIGINHRF